MKNKKQEVMLLNNKERPLLTRLWNEKILYLMFFPTLLYFILFRVWPILNMRLAFFQFRARGSWNFVGMRYFNMIFASPTFSDIMANTLIISFMKYILLFPCFVGFAVILNELRFNNFRKYVQVISYLPHFLSWVVIAGIWISALSLSGGMNQILSFVGIPATDFMTNRGMIRWILMFCEAWRSLGWDSIILIQSSSLRQLSPSILPFLKPLKLTVLDVLV